MSPKILGLACMLGLAAASCAAPTTPAPVDKPAQEVTGPAEEPTRHVLATIPAHIPTTGRCYTLRTERVVFKVLRVKSDNRSDWNLAAQGVPNECKDSAVWDDQWYFYWLRSDIVDNLMLVWKNIDRHEYGYVVVKNTPTVWMVYSSGGGPWLPKNGEQIKRTWHSDGTRIDIDVKNPNNVGDWGPNDIWVSFGY